MNNVIGMIRHVVMGCPSWDYTSRYKKTKENLSINADSLQSMVLRGEEITHFNRGQVFRVTPSPLNRHTLGIATRHGPVVVRMIGDQRMEMIMNAALEPYVAVMKDQETKSIGHSPGNVEMWLGCVREFKHAKPQVWYNIGQIVELAEANLV